MYSVKATGCWVTLTQQECNLLPYEEERQVPLNPLLHLIVPEIKPAMIIKLWKDIFQSWRNNTAFPCQHNNCTVDPAIPFKINNDYNDYNDKGTCTGLFCSSSRHSRWPFLPLGDYSVGKLRHYKNLIPWWLCSLHCRANLTLPNNVCEALPRSLF